MRRILLLLVGTQILSTFIDDRCAAENHHAHAGFCGSRAGACAEGAIASKEETAELLEVFESDSK